MLSTKIRTIILAAVAVLAIAAVAAPSAALAKKKNKKASITLVVNGGDFSGKIKDKKHPQCLAEREVTVFNVQGNEPGPSDTSDADGSWNTGNNGANDGSYYAFTPATPGCKALTSKIGVVTGRGGPEPEDL